MLLEIKDLRIEFHDHDVPERVVHDVSFSLAEGEILGIVGESGSGKSMTAMAVAGLLKRHDVEKKGAIFFEGTELLHASRAQLRKVQGNDISIIFQEPMTSLNPVKRIGWQVEESLKIHRPDMSREERRSRAIAALSDVELPNPEQVYKKYPHELSGGMRQRVMIASAMICEPKLLIADEPTTALDVTIQAQILELMQELQKKLGMAIIMVTHDLGVIADMCDEIIVMYGGRVCERGTAEDIFYRPGHEYTKGLLRSVPKADGSKERLVPIAGTPINLLNMPKGCAFCTRCDEAMKICLTEVPPQVQMPDGHFASCWLAFKKLKNGTLGAEEVQS